MPRSELSGLLISSRLLMTVLKAMSEKPDRVIVAGDSQCTIAALEKSGEGLGAYFCNRVSEILQNFDLVRAQYPDTTLDPVYHLPGKINPAYLITRETGSALDLMEGSDWFCGPDFLQQEIEDMPLSRDFLNYSGELLPPEELRTRKVIT